MLSHFKLAIAVCSPHQQGTFQHKPHPLRSSVTFWALAQMFCRMKARPFVSRVQGARTKLLFPLQTHLHFFPEILPRMTSKISTQQRYTFTFRVCALILTGSCDRLPTAARVTHCRPDCISSAQELTARDPADGGACFSLQSTKSGKPSWSLLGLEAGQIQFCHGHCSRDETAGNQPCLDGISPHRKLRERFLGLGMPLIVSWTRNTGGAILCWTFSVPQTETMV